MSLSHRLRSALKVKDITEAEAAVGLIHEDGARVHHGLRGEFLTLTSAFAREGDAVTASRWLHLLIKAGLGRPTIICVNMVISACAKQADVAKAEEWLERMWTLGLKPDVSSYNCVMDACARARDVVRAERWMELMHPCAPDVVTYSSMLNACVRANELKLAESWLRRMRSWKPLVTWTGWALRLRGFLHTAVFFFSASPVSLRAVVSVSICHKDPVHLFF